MTVKDLITLINAGYTKDDINALETGIGGATPPAGETTPPAGETTPPAGGTTPPVGETTPPAGGETLRDKLISKIDGVLNSDKPSYDDIYGMIDTLLGAVQESNRMDDVQRHDYMSRTDIMGEILDPMGVALKREGK